MHNPSSAHPKSLRGQGSSICRLDQLPPAPPREEIVQGLIAAGEIGSLSGRPGEGKTALAIHLAKAVTEGGEFLGRPCIQGPVLFVACEKAAGTERRLKAIIQRQEQASIRNHAIRLDLETNESPRVF